MCRFVLLSRRHAFADFMMASLTIHFAARVEKIKDLPAKQQLSLEQVLKQIPTFLVTCTPRLVPLPTSPSMHQMVRNDLSLDGLGALSTRVPPSRAPHTAQVFPHDAPSMDALNPFAYLNTVA
jgi:hypothetical protein